MLKILRNSCGGHVGNAVVWAAVMLASAIVTRGTEASGDLLIILIAGWFASSTLFVGKK